MVESQIISFLTQYGLIFMFGIIFLEYLNLPGFPAGVIFPAVGIWSSVTNISLWLTLLVSILAGFLGSTTLFLIGKYGGGLVIEPLKNKSPAIKRKLESIEGKLRDKGAKTIFFTMLIPVARTLIPFPAGAMKMKFSRYAKYSLMGIGIWNIVLITFGAMMGNIIAY